MILASLVEIPFFVAISAYYSKIAHKWLIRTGFLAGVTNGLSVLMSGVFTEHINMDLHITWSYLIFFSFIPVLLAYNLAFRGMLITSKSIRMYGFIVCGIDIFFLTTILIGGQSPGLGSIMEWFSVFIFLAWVKLVSLDLLKKLSPKAGPKLHKDPSD